MVDMRTSTASVSLRTSSSVGSILASRNETTIANVAEFVVNYQQFRVGPRPTRGCAARLDLDEALQKLGAPTKLGRSSKLGWR